MPSQFINGPASQTMVIDGDSIAATQPPLDVFAEEAFG
jgi:hypothetical protein